MTPDRPYADPNHPGNRIRPTIRCFGCGQMGCVTQWGPWCFTCNVARMDKIGAFLSEEGSRSGGSDEEVRSLQARLEVAVKELESLKAEVAQRELEISNLQSRLAVA